MPSHTGVHSGNGNGGTGSGTGTGTTVSTTNGPVPKGFHRTVILFEGRTSNGQDLFIRGGIDESHRQGNVVMSLYFYFSYNLVHYF